MGQQFTLLWFLLSGVLLAMPALAQEAAPVSTVLITNVTIFDGKHERLAEGMSVLVEGNKIARTSKKVS